ncbi:RidA family protein [Arenibacterium halophilum]|uniref:RidA family protein n=1 Tax=Arenibacterium halophilum TaxID=2583821 RepID=A0ABY2X8G3_9RHOB|nr:RidA family protein [Arenibacterium halophilum]TMV12656.1 RidA family protein [Arenibacterium halophilum]
MQRRRSIYLDGFGHKNPIPAACMIDGLLMTGIIYGQDPETGKAAEGLERQTELMFTHLRAILDAAGMTTEDILKVDVLLLDRSQRGPLNAQWEAMFPDPDNRPVRQAMQADLDNGKLIQCNVTARAAI